MLHPDNFEAIVRTLSKANKYFVAYKLPKQSTSIILATSHLKVVAPNELEHVILQKGFLIYPFSSNQNHVFFIPAHEEFQDIKFTPHTAPNYQFNLTKKYQPKPYKQETYETLVAELTNQLKQGEFEKITLARTKFTPYDTSQLLKLYQQLCTNYPNAFVYLFHLPNYTTWIGATPELLLSIDTQNQLNTMSLAATKQDETDWNTKEKNEQDIVTTYINDILSKHQVKNLNISPLDTLNIGHLTHLKTMFSAQIEADFNLVNVLTELHPTPAVAGIPKTEAIKFILQNESEPRNYYAGFLGPININKKAELFVNLRCAEVFQNGLLLYAGAGITKQSDPKTEFLETEAKFNIISRFLN